MATAEHNLSITAELIEEEQGGYTVYCPELDIFTQGDDREDALNNLKEAAEMHIEEIGLDQLKLKRVQYQELHLKIHG